jgi:ketosteroid isomerase-like protein
MPTQVAAAAPLTDEDRTTIRKIIAKFDQDMLAGNRPALVAIYTDDAVMMPPNAPVVRGRSEIQQFFEAFPKVTEFAEYPVEIDGEGDVAFPWGTYEMALLPADATKPVKDRGKVLGIWRKQPDGTWLVSRVCWNSDLAPVT